MTTRIYTHVKASLLYSAGGRSIETLESKVYQSSVTPDVNITVTSLSALTATKILDNDTDDVPQVKLEDEADDDEETSDESLITDTTQLLSQIQKNGPTSEVGSIAFLRLCLKLEQIGLITYEKLISKYKTKKIFKYFVEASSVIHKVEFLDLILSHLSRLKNKKLLGNAYLNSKYLFKQGAN